MCSNFELFKIPNAMTEVKFENETKTLSKIPASGFWMQVSDELIALFDYNLIKSLYRINEIGQLCYVKSVRCTNFIPHLNICFEEIYNQDQTKSYIFRDYDENILDTLEFENWHHYIFAVCKDCILINTSDENSILIKISKSGDKVNSSKLTFTRHAINKSIYASINSVINNRYIVWSEESASKTYQTRINYWIWTLDIETLETRRHFIYTSSYYGPEIVYCQHSIVKIGENCYSHSLTKHNMIQLHYALLIFKHVDKKVS